MMNKQCSYARNNYSITGEDKVKYKQIIKFGANDASGEVGKNNFIDIQTKCKSGTCFNDNKSKNKILSLMLFMFLEIFFDLQL